MVIWKFLEYISGDYTVNQYFTNSDSTWWARHNQVVPLGHPGHECGLTRMIDCDIVYPNCDIVYPNEAFYLMMYRCHRLEPEVDVNIFGETLMSYQIKHDLYSTAITDVGLDGFEYRW